MKEVNSHQPVHSNPGANLASYKKSPTSDLVSVSFSVGPAGLPPTADKLNQRPPEYEFPLIWYIIHFEKAGLFELSSTLTGLYVFTLLELIVHIM